MAKDNWDELNEGNHNRHNHRRNKKKGKRSSRSQDLDDEYASSEEDKFLSNLASKNNTYGWMKEARYKRMFSDIENKIQGAMGTGSFDWVDRRVFDQVFDRLTLMSLYKLMKTGVIDTLDYPIARGKEAHVFHGTNIDGKSVAVKIFHTSNAVFKNLVQYIEGDPRFGGLRRRHRDLVDIWVRKEHRNLSRLSRWGLNVPKPLGIHKNVLVMDYLGHETGSSPKLREVNVEEPEPVFEDLLKFLAVAWQKSNLVHGDFSPFNILWHQDRAVVIDVGQAVVQGHPKAEEFLVRDVTRLVEWANKNGIDVTLAEAMFEVLNMNLDHVKQIKFDDEEE